VTLSTACYINEFRPLAERHAGRNAIADHQLPPFIDGSCRREPDLESAYPSITALCREMHFAPRLREGDVVAYMTKDFQYPGGTESCRRLVAVLRVHRSWRSAGREPGTAAHEQAAKWYQQQGLPAPCNCMVKGSEPLPLRMTDKYRQDLREWEAHYWQVARTHGVFHACDSIFCDIDAPPRMENRQLVEWFGAIPNPREMSALATDGFIQMLQWLMAQTSGAVRTRLEELEKSLLHHAFTGEL
jgi:hypothetical protein